MLFSVVTSGSVAGTSVPLFCQMADKKWTRATFPLCTSLSILWHFLFARYADSVCRSFFVRNHEYVWYKWSWKNQLNRKIRMNMCGYILLKDDSFAVSALCPSPLPGADGERFFRPLVHGSSQRPCRPQPTCHDICQHVFTEDLRFELFIFGLQEQLDALVVVHCLVFGDASSALSRLRCWRTSWQNQCGFKQEGS